MGTGVTADVEFAECRWRSCAAAGETNEERAGRRRPTGVRRATKRPFPFATLAVLAASVVVYLTELAGGGMSVCQTFGFVPAHATFATALSSLLVHDPDHVAHIAGNMLVLSVVGAVVEPVLGHLRFALLYFASGVAGALLHVAVDPQSSVVLVGCSGSIAGIMAVLGVLRPRSLGFVVMNVYWAWTGTAEGISFAAHLGGFSFAATTVLLSRARGARWLVV
jgi:membrane associated rhomboid family serine protease